ncbi:MAG TPA: PAS domain S-box protein [Hyphomicrobiaceae bacterium]|jgi:PAS domain S-box-containing protein
MLGISNFHEVFLSTMPDGVLLADKDGVIRMWNAGCERIFGFTAEEAIGQPLDIIIPENLRARHGEGYAQTMRTGKTRYGQGDLLSVPALHKNGTRISVEFSILPFRDAEGRMVGIGAVLRDVTRKFEEMKALKKALAAARAG